MATIEQLYQQILGRPADPAGLAYYQNLFGPTIEPEEVNAFLSGALASGEVSDVSRLQPAAQSFVSNLGRQPDVLNLTLPTRPAADNVSINTVPISSVRPGTTVATNVATPTPTNVATTVPTNVATTTPGYGGATRDQVLGLYRSVGLPDPAEEDIAFWQNFSQTNPDVLGAANPLTQLTNAFRDASRQQLTPDELPTTGESAIDPLIAPYLQEALGVARNLFLTGEGPELYPGQMYVSPSASTLDALTAAENLGRSTTVSGLGEDVFGAYAGGLGTLANLASPDYMKSQEYQDYVSSITRPITEAVTEDIIPGIQSGFSRAGRYGSGAMGDIAAKATGRAATAIGDVTSRIAQQERQNQFGAVTALPGFLSNLSGVTAGALAPSGILAGVGAQREAISGQPLQESIRRFEYGQQLPSNQLSAYLSSIYGSPLGRLTGQPEMQGNSTLQNIGGLFNVASAVPGAVQGVQTDYNFLRNLF
jgi:hypothetical protein